MGITGDTWEPEALTADCRILQVTLTHAVELATLHAHLQLDPQHRTHGRRGCTLPTPNFQKRHNETHSLHPRWTTGSPTPQKHESSRRIELNKKASEIWRQHLFGKADPTSDAPTDDLH